MINKLLAGLVGAGIVIAVVAGCGGAGIPSTSTPAPPTATPAPTGLRIGNWELIRKLEDGDYSAISIQTESVRGDSAVLRIICIPESGTIVAVGFEQPFVTVAGNHEIRVSSGSSFETQVWNLTEDKYLFTPADLFDHAGILFDLEGAQEFQFVADLEIDPERWTSFDVTGFEEAERQISPCDAGKVTVITTARLTPSSTSTLQLTALGIDRQSVTDTFMETFEDPAVAFMFVDAPLPDGTPRMLGRNPQDALIQLIGPPHNLTKASVSVDLVSDETVNTINGLVMALLIFSITSWQDSANWLTEATLRIYDERIVTTKYNGYNIQLVFLEDLEALFLEITR